MSKRMNHKNSSGGTSNVTDMYIAVLTKIVVLCWDKWQCMQFNVCMYIKKLYVHAHEYWACVHGCKHMRAF